MNPGIKTRSPVRVILYSLLTLGIYYLYWLASVRKSMVKEGQKVPSVDWLLAPLVILVLTVILLVIFGEAEGGGVPRDPSVFEVVANVLANLLFIAFVGLYVWWYWRFAKALEHVTGGKIRAPLTVIVLWAAGPAGAGIVQDQINQLPAKD